MESAGGVELNPDACPHTSTENLIYLFFYLSIYLLDFIVIIRFVRVRIIGWIACPIGNTFKNSIQLTTEAFHFENNLRFNEMLELKGLLNNWGDVSWICNVYSVHNGGDCVNLKVNFQSIWIKRNALIDDFFYKSMVWKIKRNTKILFKLIKTSKLLVNWPIAKVRCSEISGWSIA